jgi:6-pyruvoyltetrahydropterin/6-carboxytetrahydropterin synthase
MAAFRIRVEQDTFKFSSAHFLLFYNGVCERVHGHNYRAWVELEGVLEPNDYVFDFIAVKPLMRAICERLDHRVLLPGSNPELMIETTGPTVEAAFRGKRYRFPAEDVLVLPIHNTTAELLARYICHELRRELAAQFEPGNLSRITVGVQESFGQEASYEEAL